VLYEMLTGETLFAGDTMSEKLAAIIKDEPTLDRVPSVTPPAIRRLLARFRRRPRRAIPHDARGRPNCRRRPPARDRPELDRGDP
jgi:hypothetical protein